MKGEGEMRYDYKCPTCRQDMRAKWHLGMNNKDCPQCGQGLQWRKRKGVTFPIKRRKDGEKRI